MRGGLRRRRASKRKACERRSVLATDRDRPSSNLPPAHRAARSLVPAADRPSAPARPRSLPRMRSRCSTKGYSGVRARTAEAWTISVPSRWRPSLSLNARARRDCADAPVSCRPVAFILTRVAWILAPGDDGSQSPAAAGAPGLLAPRRRFRGMRASRRAMPQNPVIPPGNSPTWCRAPGRRHGSYRSPAPDPASRRGRSPGRDLRRRGAGSG